MKKYSFVMFCMAVIFTVNLAFAQEQPTWSVGLGSKASWVSMNFSGILVASAGDALYGIDPLSKKVQWKLEELAGTSEDDFDEVPSSPYAVIDKMNGKEITQSTVINALTGKVLYDTKKDGATYIFNKNILFSIKAMILEVVKNGYIAFVLVDLETGNILWTNPTGKATTGGLIKKSFKTAVVPIFPVADKDGNIILPYENEKIMRVNGKTGEIIWDIDEKLATSFFLSKDGNTLVLINEPLSKSLGNSKLIGINVADGSRLWKEDVKLEGDYTSQKLRDEDFIIIHSRGFNMIDYKTGESRWEKERTFKDISQLIETDEGFVIAQENNIDYVGLKGKSIWKKEVEVADKNETVNFMAKADKGILFISPTLCNMLDLNSGKDVWKKELKMKKDPLGAYDAIHNKYVAFTSGDLYLIDQDAGEYKLLAENIKFQYSEKPESIEARENGYFLSSPQNAVFVSSEGKVVYQNAYKDTKLVRTKKTLATIMKVATFILENTPVGGALVSAANLSFEEYVKISAEYFKAKEEAKAELDTDKTMAERLKNTKAIQNYKFVLTSLPVDGFEYVSVLQMDKDSGNVLKAITLKDQAPIYEIDEIGKRVYFVYENSIQCFEL